MCSFFSQKIMEKDQGDLADIVRGSGGVGAGGGVSNDPVSYWPIPSEPMAFPSGIEEPSDNFGDPFSSMQDPLLHELDLAGSGYFDSSNNNSSASLMKTNLEDESSITAGSLLARTILEEEMRRPCNIFSRMLQISPNSKMPISPREINPAVTTTSSPRAIKTSSLVSTNDHMVNASCSGSCSVDNGNVQISSPRNPSIKRRKSQAKKVVCIPAPAAANSRPSGEVVPSDLWAWRKYGQKPIKGSPYPRGYYRCSSSKGCSARKQVERSRTDPNMLVITYTSEHNHPWPTQRNALAGSTRSQPPKNNNNNNTASKSTNNASSPKPSNPKGEPKENNINIDNEFMTCASESIIMSSSVKEEMGESSDQKTTVEICDGEIFDQARGLSIHQSYRPVMANIHHDQSVNQQADDLFADLGELDPDPLNLLFSQGFAGGGKGEGERDKKALIDPFSLFDWSANNSSLGEAAGRGL